MAVLSTLKRTRILWKILMVCRLKNLQAGGTSRNHGKGPQVALLDQRNEFG